MKTIVARAILSFFLLASLASGRVLAEEVYFETERVEGGVAIVEAYLANREVVVLPDSLPVTESPSYRGETLPVVAIHTVFFNKNLRAIYIPKSVEHIGGSAFRDCPALETIVVSDMNEHYRSIEDALFTKDGKTLVAYPCGKSGKECVVPDGTTEIGAGAFDHCRSLVSISVPNSVDKIGRYAFNFCEKLESINLPESVSSIGDRLFADCKSLRSIALPEGIERIGSGALTSCESLESLTIPSSVVEIGENAFEGCKSLRSITIPEKVSKIESGLFSLCERLKSIEVSEKNEHYRSVDGVLFTKDLSTLVAYPSFKGPSTFSFPPETKRIGARAFLGCNSPYALRIPETIESIGPYAFSLCKHLRVVEIPKSVKEIGQGAFSYCKTQRVKIDGTPVISNLAFGYNFELELLELGEGVEKIGDHAFYYAGLIEIKLPKTVVSIDRNAFSECHALRWVELNDGLVEIGSRAFEKCRNLESIKIPNTVEKIGEYAFEGCKSLKTIERPAGAKVGPDRLGEETKVIEK